MVVGIRSRFGVTRLHDVPPRQQTTKIRYPRSYRRQRKQNRHVVVRFVPPRETALRVRTVFIIKSQNYYSYSGGSFSLRGSPAARYVTLKNMHLFLHTWYARIESRTDSAPGSTRFNNNIHTYIIHTPTATTAHLIYYIVLAWVQRKLKSRTGSCTNARVRCNNFFHRPRKIATVIFRNSSRSYGGTMTRHRRVNTYTSTCLSIRVYLRLYLCMYIRFGGGINWGMGKKK